MKIYLLIKYCFYSTLISIAIMLIGLMSGAFTSMLEMMVKSFFFGSVIGLLAIYFYFNSMGLWNLYDNLRINKNLYLGLSFISFNTLIIVLSLIIHSITHGI